VGGRSQKITEGPNMSQLQVSLSLQPLLQRLPPALEKSAASLRLAVAELSATASLAATAALCAGDGSCTMAIWGCMAVGP
jgi:hypothetical protein